MYNTMLVERLNITLDDEQAEKLSRLAERMHVQPGTVARSLLSSALDEAEPDAMASVELAAVAVEDLDELIRTHSLPVDTRSRVKRSLRALERFPRIGPELGGRWKGFRFLLGPWRWMVFVYVFIESEDRVVVVTAGRR